MPWTEDHRFHVAAVSIGLTLMSITTAPFMGLTILHQVVLPIFYLWLVVRLGCITVLTVVSINPKANGRWEFLRSLWHEMGAPPMFQRHRW